MPLRTVPTAAAAALLIFSSMLSAAEPRAPMTWSLTGQAGMSNNFQMVLGGYFGDGPEFFNRATLTVGNVVRNGDAFAFSGWSSTDLPSAAVNWQAGLIYKYPLLTRPKHVLTISGGAQRWILPMVKTGAMDWILAGNATYATKVKKMPVVATTDSWSLLKSTLPTGSVIYNQIYAEHRLLRRGGLTVALRHGPAHTYSWNFYGANGNRVVRYSATGLLNYRGTTFDVSYRQQFGLQDGIKYNRYWIFSVTRQLAHGTFRQPH